MGSSDRARRAAKQQARARHAQRMANGADARSLDANGIAGRLWAAANDYSYGQKHTAAAEAEYLADADDRQLGIAVAGVFHRALNFLWPSGWLPYDLVQVISRECDGFAVGFVTDVIAVDMSQHAEATLHERWRDQLRQIEARPWWPHDRQHFEQWLARHILSKQEGLEVVIVALATLMALPKLPLILPLPGSSSVADVLLGAGVDQKVLAKVRGLLAKAESTEFPEEAEALSAKAQELMSRHAFERALLDADEHVAQTASSRRVWLDTPYVGAKAQLVAAVAAANRSRGVVYEKLGFIALIGADLDLEITELLSTSLLLQATRAMVASGAGVDTRSRTYRQSFLLAYAVRIGQRLRAAAEESDDHAADDRLLPVLADREKAVSELFEELHPATVKKSYTVGSTAGWQAGTAAADQADLGVSRPNLTATR
ncbi:DUF2786 domain-containing protein [Kutzneria sp. 744]|uniref:DUF2786 domain-containing protein n=1 Tax=Kutzneria sp. (strain 744) TaxID=345341 RepID=UPI0003EEDE87|nr:DUF2786 domain-containing protein [Kutzneria sp. 744]EWM15336.1 hypothetical protein KUTG_05640 [Kutzneria sp. 744]